MSGLQSLPVLSGPADQETYVEPGFVSHQAVLALPLVGRTITPDRGYCYRIEVPARFFAQLPAADGEVFSAVLENNQVLGPQPAPHELIRKVGRGHVSVYYEARPGTVHVFLSTSDNTDPRTNGRTYTVLNQPIGFCND